MTKIADGQMAFQLYVVDKALFSACCDSEMLSMWEVLFTDHSRTFLLRHNVSARLNLL